MLGAIGATEQVVGKGVADKDGAAVGNAVEVMIDIDVIVDMPTRRRPYSANTCRRVAPRRRIGRLLVEPGSTSPIAAFSSARLWNRRLRADARGSNARR
jgi:hypothetical protein